MGRQKMLREGRNGVAKDMDMNRRKKNGLETRKSAVEKDSSLSPDIRKVELFVIERELKGLEQDNKRLEKLDKAYLELEKFSQEKSGLEQKLALNTAEFKKMSDLTTTVGKNLADVHEGYAAVLDRNIIANKDKAQRTNDLMKQYLETYKLDHEKSVGLALAGISAGLLIGLPGLAMGIAALVEAVKALNAAATPTPTPTPHNLVAPITANLYARRGPTFSFANTDTTTEVLNEEPTEDELIDSVEEMMQNLVVSKDLIASGEVPQDLLWQSLAKAADKNSLEGQDFTLIFIQEALVDFPETQDFLWLDPSEMQEKYQQLYEAYQREGKLSDVYMEATKLEYNDQKIPFFHVASLLQLTFALVAHHLKFPDEPIFTPVEPVSLMRGGRFYS